MKTNKHIHLIPSPLAVAVLSSYQMVRTWRPSARPATRCNGMQHRNVFFNRISKRNPCRIPAPGCCAIQHDTGHVHRHHQNIDRIPTAQPTVPVHRPSENRRQPNDSKHLILNWLRLFKKNFHAPDAQSCTTAPSALPPQALSFRPTPQPLNPPFYRRSSAFIGGPYQPAAHAIPLQ